MTSTPVTPQPRFRGPWQALLVPLTIAMLGMLGPFSIDTPYPAFPEIQEVFGTDKTGTQQLVSTYLIAFAAMSILHGPISDAIGRKPVIYGGLIVYGLASLAAMFAPSFETLIACRIVQGLSAGGSVIVSRTMVRDIYSGPQAQRLMSKVMMIFGLAPAIAPIIGGWILLVGDWRAVFGFLVGISALLILVVAFVLPETHPPENRIPLRVGSLVSSVWHVAKNTTMLRLAFTASFMFGTYFIFIGTAAIYVIDLLGKGPQDFWMLFVPLVAGFITGSFISGQLAERANPRSIVSLGLGVLLGATVLNVVLMLFPHLQGLPWAVIGPALCGLGCAIAFPAINLAILDLFPHTRGSASSVTNLAVLLHNAVGAGVLAPIATRSLLTLGIVAVIYASIAVVIWIWHLVADTPTRAVP